MESLENQVREGLIQKRTNETYQQMQEPKYKGIVRDFAKNMFGSMFGALGDQDLGKEELAEFNSEMEGEIEKLVSNPEQLRQQAYQQAQQQYMTREQWKAKFGELYGTLNEDGDFGTEAMSEFQKANERLYHFFNLQDRIVRETTEVAEREGVKKALTDETQHEVTRRIFPTKDEYIAHQMGGMQAMKDYFAHVQQAMMMDGEMGELIGAMCGGMQKALEGMKEMSEQAVKDWVFEKAQEIYGA